MPDAANAIRTRHVPAGDIGSGGPGDPFAYGPGALPFDPEWPLLLPSWAVWLLLLVALVSAGLIVAGVGAHAWEAFRFAARLIAVRP